MFTLTFDLVILPHHKAHAVIKHPYIMNLSIQLTIAANVWIYMHISWVFLHLNLSILSEKKISNYSDNDDDDNNDNNDKLCNTRDLYHTQI